MAQPPITLPPPSEQRRSPRFAVALPVDLHTRAGSQRLLATDVGRNGLFIQTATPAAPRHILRLTLHLEDEHFEATAIVSRVLPPESPTGAGMGLQFFAMGAHAKQRWDSYIQGLEGGAPVPRQDTSRVPDDPVFYVRPRDNLRLKGFFREEVTQVGMVLHTPLLKDVGSRVRLVVVHPVTHEEAVLPGLVEAVVRGPSKAMSIRFTAEAEHLAKEFLRFCASGRGVVVEDPAALEVPIEVELPVENGGPDFDVDEGMMVEEDPRFSITDDHDRHPLPEDNLPYAVTVPPYVQEPSTDASALEWQALVRPSVLVRVTCTGCREVDDRVKLGGVDGPLGVVARWRPLWCSMCRTVTSVPGALDALSRLTSLGSLDAWERAAPVGLETLFQAAALKDPQKCPQCHMLLKEKACTRRLLSHTRGFLDGSLQKQVLGHCPVCSEGKLVAEVSLGLPKA